MNKKVSIDDSLKLLSEGEVVAVPTETVYGLACDATNKLATEKVYALKTRPKNNPLIIHVSSIEMAERYVHFDSQAMHFAKKLWQDHKRSITFVLNKKSNELDHAINNKETVAIRIPHHPITIELIDLFQKPLAAPSANISTKLSPTMESNIDIDCFILSGGQCSVGIESTILDLTTDIPSILRHGECTANDISKITGVTVNEYVKGSEIECPGHFGKHYSPNLKLRINVENPSDDEAYLCLGPVTNQNHFSLSETYDLREAAKNLFATIKKVDNPVFSSISIAPIPSKDIGIAINDRLYRASIS